MSTVHVIGAAGFAGAQTAALLEAHPFFELGILTARSDAGRPLSEVHPEYRVDTILRELDLADVNEGDFAAVAYPHAEAAVLVAELLERGLRVVDISADHRLRDPGAYPEHYGFDHPNPDLLVEAVYGLPEINRDAIAGARLVANPGCYPTAAILALLPFAGALGDVVIDAKSGVSGAGRTPGPAVHYSFVADSVWPYKVLSHRHTPEIVQELEVPVLFTPHLVPVDRGLLASCYAVPTDGLPEAPREVYEQFYDSHPFVEVVAEPPTMRAVQHTNFARVHVAADPASGRLLAFCVIDNLVKGAAGQAVQNLNLMAGRDETEGLM